MVISAGGGPVCLIGGGKFGPKRFGNDSRIAASRWLDCCRCLGGQLPRSPVGFMCRPAAGPGDQGASPARSGTG